MRTITVKGTGSLRAKPDLIVISMTINAREKECADAVDLAAERLAALSDAVAALGFDRDSLKTTDFNITAEYENKCDKNGNYRRRFSGYNCCHRLKLEFDLDTSRLTDILSAIGKCPAKAEVDVEFTIKDKNAVCTALLQQATENARQKAEILTSASGVKLTQLINILYDWSELALCSKTRYNVDNEYFSAMSDCIDGIAINPDDISVSDSATFIWKIE